MFIIRRRTNGTHSIYLYLTKNSVRSGVKLKLNKFQALRRKKYEKNASKILGEKLLSFSGNFLLFNFPEQANVRSWVEGNRRVFFESTDGKNIKF